MRKLLTLAASSAALIVSGSALAETVTFSGTLGMVSTAANQPAGATNPVGAGNESFTITLDYDDDSVNSAVITIGGDTDDAEVIRASVLDIASTANPNALDQLDITLVSTDGSLPGNFNIGFEFFNTALDSDSLIDAFAALGDMGMLVCSHFMFDFGGFKFEGTLDEGGITFNPVGEVPLPGAAIFMLSGLAAAGVARRTRKA